jgi:hypothetical protein
MSDETARLKLPQLVSQQEMTNVTWNEALAQLDALVCLMLLGRFVNTPPSAPADGDAYLTGAAPTGAWSGYPYKIATCLDGGWRFLTPFDGLRAWCAADKTFQVYRGGAWSDVAGTLTGPLDLGGGQIKFPATQVPALDPNTLDDYEEGSWTPILTASTTPPTGQAIASVSGTYVKIGRLVHVCFNFNGITPGTGASGVMRVTGLPFVPRDSMYRGGIVLAANITLDAGYTFFQGSISTPFITIAESGSGITGLGVPYTNLLLNANLRGQVTYETD